MPLYLGIEIGGTKLQLALGHGNGRIDHLIRRTVNPSQGGEGIRRQIIEAFAPFRGQVDGVGIGFGGPVDVDLGVTLKSHQIAGWDQFPLVRWAAESFDVNRVQIQNDADTAALGEARYGAGIGISPLLYLTIGSGIGGGLVVDGAIYRGSGLGAMEIGHLWIDQAIDGEIQTRTLENWASGWAIGRQSGTLSAVEVAQAAASGDLAPLKILDRATTAMSRALAHAATLLAPRRIVLGGGVSLMREDLWIGSIRRKLDEFVFPPYRGTFDVVSAKLGEEVVLHGALALASM